MDQDQELQTMQQNKQLQSTNTPPHFNWPHSKPGPHATQPPPGMKPMTRRTDQMMEVDYNQETGEPSTDSPARTMPDASLKGSTSFDQSETAQEAMQKRRK